MPRSRPARPDPVRVPNPARRHSHYGLRNLCCAAGSNTHASCEEGICDGASIRADADRRPGRSGVSTPHQLVAEVADPARTTAEQEARYLVWLSRLALRKYRRLRLAVDLLLTALAGTAGTAVLTFLNPGG